MLRETSASHFSYHAWPLAWPHFKYLVNFGIYLGSGWGTSPWAIPHQGLVIFSWGGFGTSVSWSCTLAAPGPSGALLASSWKEPPSFSWRYPCHLSFWSREVAFRAGHSEVTEVPVCASGLLFFEKEVLLIYFWLCWVFAVAQAFL